MALANNALNTMALTLEPTYSGLRDKTCTAELFIEGVKSQRAAANLTDAQTIAYAMKFLRGDALSFFRDYYPAAHPEHAARIMTNWEEWLQVFTKAFFAVGAASHVSTGWARMRQLQSETIQEFANRTSSHLKAYTEYLPTLPADTIPDPYPVTDEDVTDFLTWLEPLLEAPTPAQVRAMFAPRYRRVANEAVQIGHVKTKAINQQTLLMKVVIAGLSDPGAREAASRMEANGKSLFELVDELKVRERSKTGGTRGDENKPAKTLPRPQLHISDMHQPEHVHIDALRSSSGGGRRRGRGRGRGSSHGSATQRTSLTDPTATAPSTQADDHEPGAICGYCGYKNHRTDQCRRKRLGIPAPTGNRMAPLQGGADDQADAFLHHYSGNENSA